MTGNCWSITSVKVIHVLMNINQFRVELAHLDLQDLRVLEASLVPQVNQAGMALTEYKVKLDLLVLLVDLACLVYQGLKDHQV
jgi:hypothetical protein